LRDLSQQKIPRELCGGEDPPYVSMFQWKAFSMGQIKKIQKHEEERDRLKIKNSKKKEGKNGGK
jgi:hypothetical protein